MKIIHSVFLVTALMVGVVNCAQADIVVVVSAKSPVSQLSKGDVSDIFLAKSGSFPGGGQAVPINTTEGSAARNEFQSKVLDKSDAQLRTYWTKLVFSGTGAPPKEVASTAEALKLISANPNMVGYIDSSQADASVKVVYKVQ